MTLTFIYPEAVDNNYKKYCFCYYVMKLLQDKYNEFGLKYKNEEITQEEWIQFKEVWYSPRQELTINQIHIFRNLAKEHNWNITLNQIFGEE